MQTLVAEFEQAYRKAEVVSPRSGDTVRVHQKIREGAKERVQMFEGVVIRTRRSDSLSAVITVRRVTSGIGVEKTFMLHSPAVERVEILRRSKVRRNFLSYQRTRTGKAARLTEITADKPAANRPKADKKPIAKAADTEPDKQAAPVIDKTTDKKAKAEAFRKAQAAKKS